MCTTLFACQGAYPRRGQGSIDPAVMTVSTPRPGNSCDCRSLSMGHESIYPRPQNVSRAPNRGIAQHWAGAPRYPSQLDAEMRIDRLFGFVRQCYTALRAAKCLCRRPMCIPARDCPPVFFSLHPCKARTNTRDACYAVDGAFPREGGVFCCVTTRSRSS